MRTFVLLCCFGLLAVADAAGQAGPAPARLTGVPATVRTEAPIRLRATSGTRALRLPRAADLRTAALRASEARSSHRLADGSTQTLTELYVDDGDAAPDNFYGWGDGVTPLEWMNRFETDDGFELRGFDVYLRTEDADRTGVDVAVLDGELASLYSGTADLALAEDGQWYELSFDEPLTLPPGEPFFIVLATTAAIPYPAGFDYDASVPGQSYFYDPDDDRYVNLDETRDTRDAAFLLRAIGRVLVETEPNDEPGSATPLPWEAALRAAIDPVGDADVYALTAEPGAFVEVRVTTTGLDAQLHLVGTDGTLLAHADRVGATGVERLYYGFPEAGTYYLRVAHYTNAPAGIARKRVGRAAERHRTAGAETGAYTIQARSAVPPAPGGLRAGNGFDRVVPLSWQPSSAFSYRVYRRALPGGTESVVGETARADFVDATVANGTPYAYRVTGLYAGTGTESPRSATVEATPAAEPHAVHLPFSFTEPVLDGVLDANEWDDALAMDITGDETEPVVLYLKNSASKLYVAVVNRNREASVLNAVDLYIDADHDHRWEEAAPAREGAWLIDDEADPVRIRFEGIRGRYPDVLVYEDPVAAPDGAEAAFGFAEGYGVYEVALELSASRIGASPGDVLGLFIRTVGSSHDPGWPAGAIPVAPATFASVTLGRAEDLPSPSPPVLIYPGDGATGIAAAPLFSWQPSDHAATYRLELSGSAAFTELVGSYDAGWNTGFKLGEPLDPLTTYYWRVVATNTTGAATSVVRAFTTARPLPAAPALGEPQAQAIGLPARPTFAWSAAVGADSYRLELSDGVSFNLPLLVVDDLTETSFTPQTALLGDRRYYWRVVAVNEAGETASAPRSFRTYPDFIALDVRRAGNDPTEVTNYRMIGLPGQSLPTLNALSLDGNHARAYTDTGAEVDGLRRLDFDTPFEPGRGIWLISRDGWQVATIADPVPLAPDRTYELALHPGWNIITNPYPHAVSWNDVRAANGFTGDLHQFDGSYGVSAVLSPYEGYYIYNYDGRASLRIPYTERPDAAARTPSARTHSVSTRSARARELTLVAEAGEARAEVRILEAADAAIGFDRHDRFAPPGAFAPLRLAFEQPALPTAYKLLGREARAGVSAGASFDLLLATAEATPVTFRVEGREAFADPTIGLIEPETARFVELRGDEARTLEPTATAQRYRLVVGDAAYIEQQRQALVPVTWQLDPAYPNPFNPRTTIAYGVPAGHDAPVELAIYDVLGRRVQSLVSGRQAAGRYTISWDGRDASGRAVASGLYYVRLRTTAAHLIQSMVLVR